MLRQRAHVNSEFLGHLRHRAAIPQRRHECLPNGLVINRLASLPGTHWLHATCALRSMKAALKEIRQLKFLDGANVQQLLETQSRLGVVQPLRQYRFGSAWPRRRLTFKMAHAPLVSQTAPRAGSLGSRRHGA